MLSSISDAIFTFASFNMYGLMFSNSLNLLIHLISLLFYKRRHIYILLTTFPAEFANDWNMLAKKPRFEKLTFIRERPISANISWALIFPSTLTASDAFAVTITSKSLILNGPKLRFKIFLFNFQDIIFRSSDFWCVPIFLWVMRV